jgi:hypothetical protein
LSSMAVWLRRWSIMNESTRTMNSSRLVCWFSFVLPLFKLFLTDNGTLYTVHHLHRTLSGQIIILSAKLRNLKYYVPIASLHRDIRIFRYICRM